MAHQKFTVLRKCRVPTDSFLGQGAGTSRDGSTQICSPASDATRKDKGGNVVPVKAADVVTGSGERFDRLVASGALEPVQKGGV